MFNRFKVQSLKFKVGELEYWSDGEMKVKKSKDKQ